jgi:hypothetical protein
MTSFPRLAPLQDQTGILAAEAKRIGKHALRGARFGFFPGVVQFASLADFFQSDVGRNHAAQQGIETGNDLDGARGGDAGKYRSPQQPVQLIGVEFSKKERNVAWFAMGRRSRQSHGDLERES